ncbi:MAG: hypothetical protein J7M18_08870 [Candidatus Eremiobacteraeota bacterium]|nr:hypothetical protein [Candidatus Eremiobacteraeota bacterium]
MVISILIFIVMWILLINYGSNYYYEKGEKLSGQEKYSQARITLKKAQVLNFFRRADIPLLLGKMDLMTGRYDSAMRNLEKGLSRNPGGIREVEALLDLARVYYQIARFHKGTAGYRQTDLPDLRFLEKAEKLMDGLELFPEKETPLRFRLGESFIERAYRQKANYHFKRVIDLNSDKLLVFRSRLELCRDEILNKKMEKGRKELIRIVKDAHDNLADGSLANILLLSGETALHFLNDITLAEKYLDEAVSLFEKNSGLLTTYILLSRVYFAQGDLDSGARMLGKINRLIGEFLDAENRNGITIDMAFGMSLETIDTVVFQDSEGRSLLDGRTENVILSDRPILKDRETIKQGMEKLEKLNDEIKSGDYEKALKTLGELHRFIIEKKNRWK